MYTKPARPDLRRRMKRAARKIARAIDDAALHTSGRPWSRRTMLSLDTARAALDKAQAAHVRGLVDRVVERAKREGIL